MRPGYMLSRVTKTHVDIYTAEIHALTGLKRLYVHIHMSQGSQTPIYLDTQSRYMSSRVADTHVANTHAHTYTAGKCMLSPVANTYVHIYTDGIHAHTDD
eukprot:1395548-Amorphochlora_amoeboformis.AAC.1